MDSPNYHFAEYAHLDQPVSGDFYDHFAVKINFKDDYIYFICVDVSPVGISVHRVHAWCPPEEGIRSPLEQGLQVVPSFPVGSGTQIQVLCRSSKCSSLLSHLFSSPSYNLIF